MWHALYPSKSCPFWLETISCICPKVAVGHIPKSGDPNGACRPWVKYYCAIWFFTRLQLWTQQMVVSQLILKWCRLMSVWHNWQLNSWLLKVGSQLNIYKHCRQYMQVWMWMLFVDWLKSRKQEDQTFMTHCRMFASAQQ